MTDRPLEPPGHIVPPEDVPPVSAEELVDGEHADGDHPDGEPEERRYPSTIGGAFYLLVLAITLVGLAVASLSDWRVGIRLIGGALLLAAVMRAFLRARDAGMLAVRHKVLDVALVAGLGLALIILAGSIPNQPGL